MLITGGFSAFGVNGRTSCTTLPTGAELYNSATGEFTATVGNLNIPRYSHTATLLNNGMVLIAGGYSTGGYVASAELYNPATGTFTATVGNLNTARELHTATLLGNGTVLIAGGYGASGYLASAEIYNPATRKFSYTNGNLNVAREFHTATLLNDGTVLIAGGSGVRVIFLASAELYNPATGTFAVTGNLNSGRYSHTATLLNNGTVLIAGGVNGVLGNDLAPIAELYSSASGTFSTTGSLNTTRELHTATLLGTGDVLVAGGESAETPPCSILVGCFFVTPTAELYEPLSLTPANLLSITLSPSTPWIPIGGSLGLTATGTFTGNTTETIYAATWSSSNTAVATVSNDSSNRGHVYGVASGSATIKACAGTVCGSETVTVAPHANLIIGSSANEGGTFETYDDSGNLLNNGNLDMSRTSHSATLLTNGTIFVAGGQGDPSSWEILNINGQTLSSGTLLNGFYSHLAMRLTNGNIFLAGGLASPGAWEIHSPTGALVGDGSLLGKRSPGAGIVVLQNGNIWISASGASFKSDECTWEIHDINGNLVSNGVLQTCFASGKVYLLSNGNVLLIGGFNAPNTYEIHSETGAYLATGNIINGFDNSAGAVQSSNNVFLFESGFWEYVGFDSNNNVTFDTTGSLLDSRLGAKGILTSTGNFFITGGSAAAGTWELYQPSGTTVTRISNGNLFDDRNVGHSDTHF